MTNVIFLVKILGNFISLKIHEHERKFIHFTRTLGKMGIQIGHIQFVNRFNRIGRFRYSYQLAYIMKPVTELSCTLRFSEGKWVLEAENFKVSAPEWEKLQELIKKKIQKIFTAETVIVKYYFDMNSIPSWFHQYQNHYFNGKFIIKT